jgi:hypothetical protein
MSVSVNSDFSGIDDSDTFPILILESRNTLFARISGPIDPDVGDEGRPAHVSSVMSCVIRRMPRGLMIPERETRCP